jgi:hypothetical protein
MRDFREHMNEMARRMMRRPDIIGNPSGFGSSAPSGGGSNCPPDTTLSSRQYVSPRVSFVTVPPGVAPFIARADVPLILPIPAKVIVCVSTVLTEQNNTVFLHFNPINKLYTGTSILPNGTESWLPMCGITTGGGAGRIGSGWVFTKELPPTTNLYLDIGQEGGGVSGPITFAVSDDIAYWKLTGTQGN